LVHVIALNLDKQIQIKLQQLTGTARYSFLGYIVNLETGGIADSLDADPSLNGELAVKLIAPMLTHYAMGNPAPLTGRLVKFKDLPGGYAYEGAFVNRAIKPIEKVFGGKPQELVEATKRLGGRQLNLGDSSAEIAALKGIPLTYILYGSEEFGASATILYDESAGSFLPTEDLAVLGELATLRLIETKEKVLG
jgi:hypothetical protein